MNKVLVLIGNTTENTEKYFTNFIPTQADIINDQKIVYFKNHASYKNLFIYLAQSLEHTYYDYKVMNSLKQDKEIQQVGQIVQYIIHLSTPFQERGKLYVNRNLAHYAKDNLTLIYNDDTLPYIEIYKKEYNTKKAFHEDNFHDLVKQLVPSAIRQIQFVDVQMALFIGGQGAGKTRLYQKVTNLIICDQKEFDQFIFKEEQFQVVDSPSWDLTSDVNKRENLIKQYSKFFYEHQKVISTFFFILNFERFDKMKNMLLSLFTPFKKFSNRISIIVSNWQESAEEEEQKEQLTDLAEKLKIKNLLFINDTQNQKDLRQMLKKYLTGEKGISLQDTIFQVEPTDIDKQYDEKINNQVKKIEEFDRNDKLELKQNLLLQNENLTNEIQQLYQKIAEIQEKIRSNKNQIYNNNSQIRQIDWDYNRDNYKYRDYYNSDYCQSSYYS